MVKTGKLIGWVVVLAALGGAGVWFWQQRERRAQRPQYDAYPAQRGDLSVTIQATASVTPENRVQIKPSVSGRMEEVLVNEGDLVKKGQVLARMSSTDRAALIDAARASGPAEVARWEDIYKLAPLIAPLDGMVILRSIEPGQTITPADAVLVLSDHLILEALVDETDLAQIRLEQSVQIVLDAYPEKTIEGRVSHISYESKTVNNVTTYTVDVRAGAMPEFVRSGMTASAIFRIAQHTGVLLIPADAVRGEPGRQQVSVPNPAGPEQPPLSRDIQTGLTDGKRVEVTAGLTEGETVLLPKLGAATAAAPTQVNPFMPKFPRRGGGRPR